jgi:mono/diheme cytochrome c family protein
MRPGLFVIAAVMAALLWWLMSMSLDAQSGADANMIATGQQVYAENCAACHGANLEGQADWQTRDADGYLPAPPHDETGHTWHHPTLQLIDIVTRGTEAIVGGGYRSRMPGFGDVLNDDEIEAVIAYIKSTWPAAIRRRHNEMDAALSR